MDFSTIAIIAVVVIVAAIWFMRRGRPAAAGTYNDDKVRSGGSIGGGTRAHDDEAVRSGGSLGGGNAGGPRVYDSPRHESGGSIGSQTTASTRPTRRINDAIDDVDDMDNDNRADKKIGSSRLGNLAAERRTTDRDDVVNNRASNDIIGENHRRANRNDSNRDVNRDVSDDLEDDTDKPTYNDRGVKSGGSIGSN